MRQDRTDHAALSAERRERLGAPRKTTVRLASCAHLPTIKEPGPTFAAPPRHARLLRRRAADDGR
ncbi:hypothetical protein, partial [Xanthomonas phaseoli]|uniref:hypothetical protein n=1 Tax=Xanthomonas phaseoli TaxID=1985254 RepID=UPI00052821E9